MTPAAGTDSDSGLRPRVRGVRRGMRAGPGRSDAEDERRPKAGAIGERDGPGDAAARLDGQGGLRVGGTRRSGMRQDIGARRARGDDLVGGRLGAAGGIGGPHGGSRRRRRVHACAMTPIVGVVGLRLTGRNRVRRIGAVAVGGSRLGCRVVVHHDGTDPGARRQHARRRRQGADGHNTRQMPGPLAHDSSITGRCAPARPAGAVKDRGRACAARANRRHCGARLLSGPTLPPRWPSWPCCSSSWGRPRSGDRPRTSR